LKKIDPNKIEILRNWKNCYHIEKILVALKNEMLSDSNKKLWQPAEGASYF